MSGLLTLAHLATTQPVETYSSLIGFEVEESCASIWLSHLHAPMTTGF